jgi:acyl-CoA synthetase (AMP-forming)/AMP-acid ligase II
VTPSPGRIRYGDERIDPGERAARVKATAGRRAIGILESNAALAITRALELRAAGWLPVIGDDRWPAELRESFLNELASADVPPDAAWGTFTSGSTGRPRTVLRSAASWSSSHAAVSALVGLRPDDVVYAPAPLVSSLSLFAAVHALAEGVDIRLPHGHAVAAADLADATVLHATPFALTAALDAIEAGAPHSLRVALIGGDRVSAALRARAARFGVRVVGYYGAAELSFVAVDLGTGMRPFPGVELELRDGVIWVQSPFVAAGYLGDASGPLEADADGWATVGDQATLEADGAILIGGRADGAILSAGATVVPADVESVLAELPGVRAVAVLGIGHPRAGAIVAAVVESSTSPDLRSLRRGAAKYLALAQQPRRWYWSAELPRTASGKLDRAAIAAAVARGDLKRL